MPKKPRWSQHFLRDSRVVERILDAAGLTSEDRVLEIGPGVGALTLPMLERVGRLLACEIDPHWAQRLPRDPKLRVLQQDFLDVDVERLLGQETGWKVVANLPYAVTAPILEKLLESRQHFGNGMWLMVQKEVAERVVARGTRASGALSHFVQLRADPTLLFTVPARCFQPPPEVESAILHLAPKALPEDLDPARLERLVRTAFSQRRKMLKATIDPKALEAAGIDPTRRAETLTLDEFIRLERSSR